MRAITLPTFGDESALTVADVPAPELRPGHVIVDVAAAGVNRADLLQRQGHYPPPPGNSELPGLEISGTIRQVADDVTGRHVGDRVCALLAGGGYAEQALVPAGQLLPVPDGVSLVDAAALPEVACTVWSTVFMTAHLTEGETLLVHGGTSGIGTMAIQLAHARGCRVAATAGSPEKLQVCRDLGADIAIDYRQTGFVDELSAATDGHGADVILDLIGAKYLQRNVSALAMDGRLMIIGMQGGAKAELNIGKLLAKRAQVMAAGLRARSLQDKARIVASVQQNVWPLIELGRVRPIVHTRMPLERAGEAHLAMNTPHIGKILLTT